MAVDQLPELNLEYPDWRFPILEWLVKGKLPRPDGGSTHHSTSKSIRPHRRRIVQAWGLPAYSCGASSGIGAASCYKRYMLALVVTTLV
jgi:hypothetical protein